MGRDLRAELVSVLQRGGGRSAAELAKALGVDRSSVNSVLYGTPDAFRRKDSKPPRWDLTGSRATRPAAVAARRPNSTTPGATAGLSSLQLYAWQKRALDAWRRAGHHGVVEAVTGSGKTRVGLAAIAAALAEERRVLVVVPTAVLVHQWKKEIRERLGLTAGQLGDGQRTSLSRHRLVVATVQSASRVPSLLPRGENGLLVCDEVHRYGADSFAQVLQSAFGWRLGMTATFERSDEGLATHLDPYFGRVVYRLGYREALDDRVIAKFRVAVVRVSLTPAEQAAYTTAHQEARAARWWLIENKWVPADPFGEFMAAVVDLAEGARTDPTTRQARRFLTNFSKSRQIVAETPAKLHVLRHVHRAVNSSAGTLVFASTVVGARRAAATLVDQGVAAASLDSTMSMDERRAVLRRFERGELMATAAPLVLDEGVDVPEANLAVILAASKTRRQMIQRLGRVVRVKRDDGKAHVALVVARATSEDPATGAHMDFIDEMLEVADELRLFDQDDLDGLDGFLQGGQGGRPFRLGEQLPDPPATSRAAPTVPRPARTEQPAVAPRPSLPPNMPVWLLPRIRGELRKGPRTYVGLADRLNADRPQMRVVLEASPEFVQRGLWWYLAAEAPPED